MNSPFEDLPAVGLTVPVDDRVVALLRLPMAITPLYEITRVMTKHLGSNLIFRTDTGIDGWAVVSRPEEAPDAR